MRKRNGVGDVTTGEGVTGVMQEKKIRERKEKFPGCTLIPVDNGIYAKLSVKPRAQIEEIGVDIPASKMESFVIKKVSAMIAEAIKEKYPEINGGD